MKPWIRILFTTILVLALLFIAIYLFLIFQGKVLIIKQLEKVSQKKVTVSSLDITPPFNLKIKNLNIEGLLKVDSAYISPSILGFMFGSIALSNISMVKPEFTYERVAPVVITEEKAVAVAAQPKKKPRLRLILKQISIKDGTVNFVDRTVSPDGIKIIVKDINFKIANLYIFPRSVISNFELKGKIPWQEGEVEGKIEAEGWLNLFKKDMQATLKIEDIDGVYLYPYYSNWVDLEKARIQSAKLNFSSDIHGLNNNITAQCHLELTDIVRKPRPPEEGENKAQKIADAVLDIFKALNQGKIVLNFTIRTKMDQPEFGFSDIKMAFEDKMAQGKKMTGFGVQDIFGLPAKVVQGTFKGLTDLTSAVIGGTISAGKQIGQVIEDSIKKDKKEE